MIIDAAKVAFIMDAAGVREHATVLDMACGTGVLFPYYLERNVSKVIGVDFSSEMVKAAASKQHDPRIEVICGDIETILIYLLCDCCMVYNAFPHFEEPERLVDWLAQLVKPGGRLTDAHGMSLEALHRHHQGHAEHVSREMLAPEAFGTILAPWFDVDVLVSDHEKYVVSGWRKRPV